MSNALSFNGFCRSPWYGGRADLAASVDAAARAGFDLFAPDCLSLAHWYEDGHSDADLARTMRDAGIACGPLAACALLDGSESALRQLERAAHAAVALGTTLLQVNLAAPTAETRRASVEQACRLLDEICADASASLRLAIEYMPTSPLATLAETLDIVAHVGAARAGALVDIWHHSHDPAGWETLAAAPLDAIAYVEFDDALPPLADDPAAGTIAGIMAEMMERRTFPGEGVLPTARFADLVRERGYRGLVSVEVLSREWLDRPLVEFATRCRQSAARFWA